jgi:hypothetical protein
MLTSLLCLRCAEIRTGDWGPSDLSLKHTFLVYGVIDLPWKLTITDIFRAQSGFHFSAFFPGGGDDPSGDGNFNGVNWVVGRNHYTTSPFVNMDIRVAKQFNIAERAKLNLYIEMFNLFNNANPAAVQQLPGQPTPFAAVTQVLPGREGQIGVRFEF